MRYTAGFSRRGFMAMGMVGVASLMMDGIGAAEAGAPGCPAPTPEQTSGPFFPTRDREDMDADMTRVEGREGRAEGEGIHVRGRVTDEACRPVAGAVVLIWQANRVGRYEHELDKDNPRPLDPNFQSWARVATDAEGRYEFKTIKPGKYPADDQGWIRPPHIHLKITKPGYKELMTQMYFAGDPLNEPDLVYRALSRDERGRVTIEFRPSPDEIGEGAKLGIFDITLRR